MGAAGKHHLLHDPRTIREDGQVTFIDVGIHRIRTAEGKTVVQGDVDFAALQPRCRWITPVPGGVGPMTVACLLEQVVRAASNLLDKKTRIRCALEASTVEDRG